MEIIATVTGAWSAFATQITVFLPKLFGALLVFVGGWIVARLIRFAVGRLLRLIRLDVAAEKGGIKDFLAKGEVFRPLSEIMAILVYWGLMIVVLIASLDALGLPIVSDILNDIVLYIPNVVAAVLVVVLGVLLAGLLGSLVRTAASNAELPIADGLGSAAQYAVVVFSVAVALIQLGIGEDIVNAVFIILFGAVSLAFALAFGLGGRDVAGRYLDKWLEQGKRSKK